MTRFLEGRVAIVTGAGRGIGRATALALASQGAKLVVNDLGTSPEGAEPDAGPAAAVVSEIEAAGGEAIASADSVAEWDHAERIAAAAVDRFGRVDILVNNAGLSASASIWEHDPALFDRIVASHLHGTFYCTRAVASHMKAAGFGRIVNLVSRAGLLGVAGQAAYGAGKGGVFGLTNVASRELGEFGVTVNAVNPAATETRMVTRALDRFREQGGADAEMAKGLAAAMQPAENIAHLITALCHPEADRFNGEIFYVEKGTVALFDPLSTRQGVDHEGAWSVEDFLRAISTFEAHAGSVIYRDDDA